MVKNKKPENNKTSAAQTLALTDLISYQDGSVVSRTIIDKKAGTVTLFAFDEGERLSEHTAPYGALVHVLEGEVDIVISGKHVRLSEGEITLIPAHEPHSLKAVKRFKMLLTMVRS